MALETLNSPTAATTVQFHHDSDLDYLEPWTKRKRSKRPRLDNPPTEEEYLALCLIMLAQGGRGDVATQRWADTRPVTGSSPELKINPPPPAPPTPQTRFPRSTPVVKSMSAPSATRLSPQVKLWADTSGATTIPAATAAAQETAQLRGRMVRVGATVTVTLT
ncbi:Zinc finger protein AZF1 [Vitis vinifera]|uniref:Zinc finger protein AZF1 n=1 Tax=Vitis vinifera TaxID=29760 RepID=A0A438KQK0_VITVI|nr:Zinc finger protein AZF1 [Vitis vinifera]